MSTSFFGDNLMPSVAPSSKEQVLSLQKDLKARGYDPGPLDGVYGAQTAAAKLKSDSDATRGVYTESARADAVKTARKNLVTNAQKTVEVAKEKVEVATSPAASFVAQRELAVAEKKLADLEPGFFERPVWQIGLALGGVSAILTGLYLAMRGGKSRR